MDHTTGNPLIEATQPLCNLPLYCVQHSTDQQLDEQLEQVL